MAHYSTKYKRCRFFVSGTTCGPHLDLDYLFTADELHSRINDIYGCTVSDYVLIKSRCGTFDENARICSRHHYQLCEGYVSKGHCMYPHCYSTKELMQMGARAALFIRYVPILGNMCSTHRAFFEEQMLMRNFQPVLHTRIGWPTIWDCVVNTTPINIRPVFVENLLTTVTNQQRCDDRSSHCKSENTNSTSTVTYTDLLNSSPVKNDVKTTKIHVPLPTKQDDNSLERDVDSNQHQPNVSMPKNDAHVIQETKTNQASKARKFTRRSSSSKGSDAELMETQGFIYIKICASPSTRHKWQEIPILKTDTSVTLKIKIMDTFSLNHNSSDLSLLYASSHSDDIQWKTLEKEDENRTLIDLSFGDDPIVTCASPKYLEKGSICTSCDVQQLDCPTDQYDVYPLTGLQNFGNTCFMNSALQCLNHVEQFFNYFRDIKIKTLLDRENIGGEKNSMLARLYSELIESLCSSHNEAVIPVEFHMEFGRLAPRFCNYHQHDSLEFMNIFLDVLHEDLMRILQQNHSIVSKTFHGKIRTIVTCQTCHQDVTTDDSLSFLPLPIPNENPNVESSRTHSYKLDQCFRTFLQGEHIGNHGQWHCEYCGKLTNAKKKLYLRELPPVLILQLKRFNYDLQSYAKNNTLIEYDLDNLDLNEYVVQSHRDTSVRYNLIAVSNHWGSLIGGHFVTYAKLPGTQVWYKYNDDRVTKVDKNVHTNNYDAYILVYQQEEKDSIIGTAV